MSISARLQVALAATALNLVISAQSTVSLAQVQAALGDWKTVTTTTSASVAGIHVKSATESPHNGIAGHSRAIGTGAGRVRLVLPLMGFFDFLSAQDARDQVYGADKPHHEVTHELLAGAPGFEAMRMFEHHREAEGITEHHELAKELLAGFAAAEVEKHFERGYHHLDREKARQAAQEQAGYLYQQQYGSQY